MDKFISKYVLWQTLKNNANWFLKYTFLWQFQAISFAILKTELPCMGVCDVMQGIRSYETTRLQLHMAKDSWKDGQSNGKLPPLPNEQPSTHFQLRPKVNCLMLKKEHTGRSKKKLKLKEDWAERAGGMRFKRFMNFAMFEFYSWFMVCLVSFSLS